MFVKMESRADNNIYEHLKLWLQCEMGWLRRPQERWIPVEERENVEFPSNQPSSWYSFGSRSNQAEPTVKWYDKSTTSTKFIKHLDICSINVWWDGNGSGRVRCRPRLGMARTKEKAQPFHFQIIISVLQANNFWKLNFVVFNKWV